MLNLFEFSHMEDILELWLFYLNMLSWIIDSCLLTETVKQS